MANITGFLKKAYPFISAAASFGGPLGTLAANAVGTALGMNKAPEPTADAIETAVAGATPEQLIALQNAENDVKVKLAQLGFNDVETLTSLAVQDRASARAREIAIRDRTPAHLAWVIVALVAAGEGYLLFHGPASTLAPELVGRIMGTLDAALMAVVMYYYGSSRSSSDKDATIHETMSNLSQ